jgi:hypothetical protein
MHATCVIVLFPSFSFFPLAEIDSFSTCPLSTPYRYGPSIDTHALFISILPLLYPPRSSTPRGLVVLLSTTHSENWCACVKARLKG